MNMFEQVSSDDRQMLEAGERGIGPMSGIMWEGVLIIRLMHHR